MGTLIFIEFLINSDITRFAELHWSKIRGTGDENDHPADFDEFQIDSDHETRGCHFRRWFGSADPSSHSYPVRQEMNINIPIALN